MEIFFVKNLFYSFNTEKIDEEATFIANVFI